jgi:protein-S-isoprenylcysteine O-methyltransferase Ste14
VVDEQSQGEGSPEREDEPTADEARAEPKALDAPAVPFLDRRSHVRPRIESAFMRLVATSGIVGICVAVAAILGSQSVQAWIIGLVASLVSVILAAILWSSRTL